MSMGPPVPEKKIWVVFTTYTLQVTSTWMHCIAVTFKVKLILDAGLCPARGMASNYRSGASEASGAAILGI